MPILSFFAFAYIDHITKTVEYISMYVSEFKLIMISSGYILKGNYAKMFKLLKVLNHIDKLFSGNLY